MIPKMEIGKAKKGKPPKRTEASLIVKGDKIYEQVWDKESGSRFITLNDKEVKFFDHVGGVHPIESDAIKKGVILLPEQPKDYGTVENIVKELTEHIRKYLDVSDDFLTFAVYYVLLSWLYDKTNTVCFLRALGDTGTGKSRFLNVIGRLLYKPCIVSGAVTPAPIYRLVERWKGSLVIDEADFKDSTEKNEVVTILNCRFERGRPVLRCDKENPDDIQSFEVFGPTVIATRKSFYDKALESRCLTEVMKETRRKDILPVLNSKFYESEKDLRNKLLKFRLDYYANIEYENIDFDFGEIEPRLKQATSSFVVLFSNIPEIAEKFKKFILKYNDNLKEERAESFDGLIVNALFLLIGEGRENIRSQDITEKMKDEFRVDTNYRTVGRHMKALGLQTKQRKIGGENKRIVVLDSEIISILKDRYVILEVSKVSSVSSYMESPSINNKLINYKEPNGTGGSPIILDTNDTIDTKVQLLKMIPNDGIRAEDLVGSAIKRKVIPISNQGLGYEIIEKLKREGIIFEPHPGRIQRV